MSNNSYIDDYPSIFNSHIPITCVNIDDDESNEICLILRNIFEEIGKSLNIKSLKGMNRPGIVGDSTLQENTTMKTRNYTPEMKERAVRMLIEAKDDYPSTWSAIKAIAPKIGCTPETLRSWHKKHIDKTIPANIQAQNQAERIKELERENRELKQANEIIKKAARRSSTANPSNGRFYRRSQTTIWSRANL